MIRTVFRYGLPVGTLYVFMGKAKFEPNILGKLLRIEEVA